VAADSAICREAMAAGRTIATIDKGIANRILDVRPNAIVRASGPAGAGTGWSGLRFDFLRPAGADPS